MTKYASWLRCRNGDFEGFVCVPFPAEHDLFMSSGRGNLYVSFARIRAF